MTKTNPNSELTPQVSAKIERKNKRLLIIWSIILTCTIVMLICVICFLK